MTEEDVTKWRDPMRYATPPPRPYMPSPSPPRQISRPKPRWRDEYRERLKKQDIELAKREKRHMTCFEEHLQKHGRLPQPLRMLLQMRVSKCSPICTCQRDIGSR
jgi:hypothetical protein